MDKKNWSFESNRVSITFCCVLVYREGVCERETETEAETEAETGEILYF